MSRTIVVDANVAVAAFRDDPRREIARRVLATKAELAAPTLFLAEVANALWLDTRVPGSDITTLKMLLERLPHVLRLEPLESLTAAAFDIARALDHPVYDAYYLALAQREATTLVTLNERLLNKTRATPYEPLVIVAEAFTAR